MNAETGLNSLGLLDTEPLLGLVLGWFAWFLFLLGLCVAVGIGARTYKNRSAILWFFIAFFLTPLVGFLLLLAFHKLEDKPKS